MIVDDCNRCQVVSLPRTGAGSLSQRRLMKQNQLSEQSFICFNFFCTYWISQSPQTIPHKMPLRTRSPLSPKKPVHCKEQHRVPILTVLSPWCSNRLRRRRRWRRSWGALANRAGALHHRCKSVTGPGKLLFLWLWPRDDSLRRPFKNRR